MTTNLTVNGQDANDGDMIMDILVETSSDLELKTAEFDLW
jgi:hypothetical protein